MEMDEIKSLLAKSPGAHAWALQDLRRWPERTGFDFVETPAFCYLLRSGHPGSQRTLSFALGGDASSAQSLIARLPSSPWLLRETPATFRDQVHQAFPTAVIYDEMRMELSPSSFHPAPKSTNVRRLVAADAISLADLHGAPPRAASHFLPWIQGATLLGYFEGDDLLSVASTYVELPEVWELVGIQTREGSRGKGYARLVTSALIEIALASTSIVTLTVLTDNPSAHRLYNHLGFRQCEERIWVDHGTGSAP